MMLLKTAPVHQAVIDLDDRNLVLIAVYEIGMYYVTGSLSITWTQTLEEFLEERMGKQ